MSELLFRADVPYWIVRFHCENHHVYPHNTHFDCFDCFDPNMGSELMMTTKNCLVRVRCRPLVLRDCRAPEGAIVRTFPERNLGQFVAAKTGWGELGTFKNITCDIELISTTRGFDQEAMTHTARKGDKAALRQIEWNGKSVGRYKGAPLTSGQVYKVLVSLLKHRNRAARLKSPCQNPPLHLSFNQTWLKHQKEQSRSRTTLFSAQTSEETIAVPEKEEERRVQFEEERRLAEHRLRGRRRSRLALEEEQRQKEEAQRLAQLEEEKRLTSNKLRKHVKKKNADWLRRKSVGNLKNKPLINLMLKLPLKNPPSKRTKCCCTPRRIRFD